MNIILKSKRSTFHSIGETFTILFLSELLTFSNESQNEKKKEKLYLSSD